MNNLTQEEKERMLEKLKNISEEKVEGFKKNLEIDLKPLSQNNQCQCCYCRAQRGY